MLPTIEEMMRIAARNKRVMRAFKKRWDGNIPKAGTLEFKQYSKEALAIQEHLESDIHGEPLHSF